MLKAVDQFLVYDPEDRFRSSLCYGEAEARKIVSDFGCTAGLIVLRVTNGDICRDVTADFIEDEPAGRYDGFALRHSEEDRADYSYQLSKEQAHP